MIGLAFFVYIRPELTQKVIESIKRNKFQKIYIFQDGLKYEKDRQAWEEVSQLISKIDFADVEIHISENNKGLANSIVEGMTYVFERHEMAIALEDDVVLADGYKSLVEALFAKYRDNKKVMSICGGGYGAVIPKTYAYDIYFAYRMSSVAFGTWKDRWDGFERNPSLLSSILRNLEKKRMFEQAGKDVGRMVFESLKGNIDTWATYWVLHQINRLGFHIIPVKEYAIDIGRNGGGTNSKGLTTRYNTELTGEKKEGYKLPDDIIINDDIVQDTMDLFYVSDNKFENYFDILCNWMKIYENSMTTEQYFIDNNISEIYIYGIGKLTNFLWNDINRNINIAGYIVENKQVDEYKGKTVYGMKKGMQLKDIPIIIVPSYDIACIRHLSKRYSLTNKLITIDEVVDYVLKKRGTNGN